MSYKSKEQQAAYGAVWYRKHRDRILRSAVISNAARRARNKEIIDAIKVASPCLDCGNFFPAICMDFDHIEGNKLNSVSVLSQTYRSVDIIMREIAKCELVCSNCHRIRTRDRRQHAT